MKIMNTLSFEGCFQTTAASSLAGRSFIMASHQPMNWMASSQGNTSIPELMSAHQRQWQEHLIMTGQQNPGTMPPMANPLGGDSSSDLITKSMSMPVTNNANPNMVMNQMNQINFNLCDQSPNESHLRFVHQSLSNWSRVPNDVGSLCSTSSPSTICNVAATIPICKPRGIFRVEYPSFDATDATDAGHAPNAGNTVRFESAVI